MRSIHERAASGARSNECLFELLMYGLTPPCVHVHTLTPSHQQAVTTRRQARSVYTYNVVPIDSHSARPQNLSSHCCWLLLPPSFLGIQPSPPPHHFQAPHPQQMPGHI